MSAPSEITYRQEDREFEVGWADGVALRLSFKALREACPCAACRGHFPGQVPPPVAREDIGVLEVLPVGQYAVSVRFSDGHDTGIYSFSLLRELADGAAQHPDDPA